MNHAHGPLLKLVEMQNMIQKLDRHIRDTQCLCNARAIACAQEIGIGICAVNASRDSSHLMSVISVPGKKINKMVCERKIKGVRVCLCEYVCVCMYVCESKCECYFDCECGYISALD